MQKATSYDLKKGFSLLIQGAPKTGKTSLALQFPRPWIADCDNNLSGVIRRLRTNGDKCDFAYDTIDVKEDGTERPLADRYSFLAQAAKAAAADPNIDTMIFDGVSKIDSYIIAEVGKQNPIVDKRQRKEGEMTLQDWGVHLFMWRNFVTRVLAVPKITIFTAHEEASDRPDLQGLLISVQGKKVQSQLQGMFSDVWRCEVEDKVTNTGREYSWFVRAMQTPSLQGLGNSLGLPDRFKMDWNTIKAALAKGV